MNARELRKFLAQVQESLSPVLSWFGFGVVFEKFIDWSQPTEEISSTWELVFLQDVHWIFLQDVHRITFTFVLPTGFSCALAQIWAQHSLISPKISCLWISQLKQLQLVLWQTRCDNSRQSRHEKRFDLSDHLSFCLQIKETTNFATKIYHDLQRFATNFH